MILLDTNVVSAMMRLEREHAVQRWLSEQAIHDLHVPIFVLFEIQFGIECTPAGRKRRFLEAQRDQVFEAFIGDRVLPFDRAAATEAAAIHASPANRSRGNSIVDFQIAGIARAAAAPIATRNGKDFAGFGVRLIDPWAP